MAPSVRDAYLYSRNRPGRRATNADTAALRRDMDLQRAFVAAGGLLLAGPDPVGIGGNLPGFGDQRQIELLVEAGFTPVASDSDRYAERRDLSRPPGSDRLDRGGQERRPRRD